MYSSEAGTLALSIVEMVTTRPLRVTLAFVGEMLRLSVAPQFWSVVVKAKVGIVIVVPVDCPKVYVYVADTG
jgi:hypothetical protein